MFFYPYNNLVKVGPLISEHPYITMKVYVKYYNLFQVGFKHRIQLNAGTYEKKIVKLFAIQKTNV